MADDAAKTSAIALTYADLPQQWGVTVRHTPAGVRVSVAPCEPWRVFPLYKVPLIFLAVMFAVTTVPALGPGTPWEPVAIQGAFYGGLLVAVLVLGSLGLRRRLVLDVTPDTFGMTTVSAFGTVSRHVWPRREIADLQYHAYSKRIVVRIPGKDTLTLFVSPEPRATEHVAQVIEQALAAPVPVIPAEARPRPVAQEHSELYPSRSRRWFGGIVAGAITLVALAILFSGRPWFMVGLYVLIPAAAVAGLSFGSRPRDFYT